MFMFSNKVTKSFKNLPVFQILTIFFGEWTFDHKGTFKTKSMVIYLGAFNNYVNQILTSFDPLLP